MKKLLTRLAIVFVVCLASVAIFTTPVAAESTGMSVQEHFSAMEYEQVQNLSKFSYESLESLAAAGGVSLTGSKKIIGTEPLPAPVCDADGKNCRYQVPSSQPEADKVTPGVIPSMGKVMTAMLISPPASTGEYIADLRQQLNPVPQAYAQGIGFAGLNPILQLWKAFRNLAYFCFIIIFIVIGFMIMFRQKIDAHTVVSVQLALPKLIVTLLLITFSYAIAGFVIDLIYLAIFVFTGLLEQSRILNPGGAAIAQNLIFGKNIIALGMSLFVGTEEVAGESAQAISSILSESLGGLGELLSFISTPIFYVIIAISITIALFRVFFMLITSYVSIILAVIFAPIQLLTNAFPGSKSFESWIRGIFANAMVFPTVAVLVLVGAALVGGKSNTSSGSNIWPIQENVGWIASETSIGWVPPLIMGATASTGVNAVRAIIGLGMIMLLPEIAKRVKEALQVKEDVGGVMGTAMSGVSMIQGVEKYGKEKQMEHYYKHSPSGTVPRMGVADYLPFVGWFK
jgi:hypothetical protein